MQINVPLCILKNDRSHLLVWLQKDDRHLPEERLHGNLSLPRLSSGCLLLWQVGQPRGKLGIGEYEHHRKDGNYDCRWERNCTEQAPSMSACNLPCNGLQALAVVLVQHMHVAPCDDALLCAHHEGLPRHMWHVVGLCQLQADTVGSLHVRCKGHHSASSVMSVVYSAQVNVRSLAHTFVSPIMTL